MNSYSLTVSQDQSKEAEARLVELLHLVAGAQCLYTPLLRDDLFWLVRARWPWVLPSVRFKLNFLLTAKSWNLNLLGCSQIPSTPHTPFFWGVWELCLSFHPHVGFEMLLLPRGRPEASHAASDLWTWPDGNLPACNALFHVGRRFENTRDLWNSFILAELITVGCLGHSCVMKVRRMFYFSRGSFCLACVLILCKDYSGLICESCLLWKPHLSAWHCCS